MATVNLGRVKPVNKGTWSSATTYAVDDFVQYTDSGVLSTYIAVASGSNQAPSTSGTENSSYWKYMSKGTTINVGNNKIVTSDGSGNLTGLSVGTAGQLLKVNSGANGYEFAAADPAIVRKIHYFEYNTRTTGNGGTTNQFTITTSFTPLDVTNNSFQVALVVPTNHAGNDYGSHGLRFSGNSYDFRHAGVQHVDVGGAYMSAEGNFGVIPAGALTAGTQSIYYRTYTNSSQPDYYNVNTSDDSRVGVQTATALTITEFRNS